MAKRSSKASQSKANKAEAAVADAPKDANTSTDGAGAPESVIGDTSLTAALFAAEKSADASHEDVTESATTEAETPVADTVPETVDVEPAPAPEPASEPVATSSPPPAQTVVERRGPGLVPLLAGGVIAAVLGYGAAIMGFLPGGGNSDQNAQIAAALEAQSSALTSLQDQVAGLSAEAPSVDLSPVLTEISGLADRLDGTTESLTVLTDRVADLEDRPVLTGEVSEDAAAMAAAVNQLEDQLGEQQAANEALAEEMRTLAEDAQSAIAEAEARAQESVAAATAQAALSRVRVAMASGDPFADALADIPSSVEVPEALTTASEAGVPTLEDLQAQFPAAARAALPIALREETADEGAGGRAVAFLRGQFAGRAIAPREGDDPDAVLSRAQAAVTSGDLATALSEISSLTSEGAQAELAGWVAAAESRSAADAALDTLATALDGAN